MDEQTSVRRFEALMLPHMHAAYNVARWLARNDQDAQDIVQDAYVRAFRFIGRFDGDDARAWLLRIVRNVFCTWYRQNRRRAAGSLSLDDEDAVPEPSDEGQSSPEALMMRDQDRRQVVAALDSLSVEHREVIVLREIEGLSYKEIASIVGVPIGTVMSRLGRGRRQLAAILTDLGQEA
ncbi:RNA polymerase subunit sigma [Burkholderia stagnalis]|uniref:RNA polymerase sigma factor n=2 Tax=Burkholderia stagnalis TaxID=1503054 RepID=A0A6L3N165_9BURK|nr:sigma-70 family RNA polymerase sigma factor [Burkholderia stagnalis]KAB0639693.1 sigma-70 family RNA polymerase sigma factor [Burkholderia stagnalis]KVL88781.1 RNA polymerase subunit sigma [Burkholderia stagnalis]KVL97025.1 RNA polymerase subunit sigma [Burkholderia stagnalis]KVM17613.1 RNA polymerase subunit sigma [Burkholderia stagnalis]KVO40933.1 RNA polymerase subunit sigma [Burkholderia stagnalis]